MVALLLLDTASCEAWDNLFYPNTVYVTHTGAKQQGSRRSRQTGRNRTRTCDLMRVKHAL